MRIFRIALVQFRKIFRTFRFLLAILWVAALFWSYMNGVRALCIMTRLDVSFWIFPLITESSGNQLFIILGALLLFCDAPYLTRFSAFQLIRAGRRNWFVGTVLYIMGLSLLYTAAIAVLPVLLMIPHVGWTEGWGIVLRSLSEPLVAAQFSLRTLNGSIISHYSPLEATLLTCAAVWLNTVIVGLINYTFNLMLAKGAGAVGSLILGLSPLLIIRLANYWMGYYFSPPLWMSLAYYEWNGYGYGVSFVYAYSVMVILIIILTIVSYWGIQSKEMNFVQE